MGVKQFNFLSRNPIKWLHENAQYNKMSQLQAVVDFQGNKNKGQSQKHGTIKKPMLNAKLADANEGEQEAGKLDRRESENELMNLWICVGSWIGGEFRRRSYQNLKRIT